MTEHRSRNRALVRFVLLPMIFLTVALMGGLRIDAESRAFVFVPPPLVTLLLSVLLMVLFVRGHLIEIKQWLSSDQPPLVNVSHALTLMSLFFASAQAFNSVLPEKGLLFWLFSFFFLWTLWNNQFASFDARRLLRSLGVLFGTAFVLKHMLLAALYAPEGGWLKRFANLLLEGVTLGTLDSPAFAPSTGYISFFTLALYVAGLVLLAPAPTPLENEEARQLMRAFLKLPLQERLMVREAIIEDRSDTSLEAYEAQPQLLAAEASEDTRQRPSSEETVITPKQ
jgi:hypothetical protein